MSQIGTNREQLHQNRTFVRRFLLCPMVYGLSMLLIAGCIRSTTGLSGSLTSRTAYSQDQRLFEEARQAAQRGDAGAVDHYAERLRHTDVAKWPENMRNVYADHVRWAVQWRVIWAVYHEDKRLSDEMEAGRKAGRGGVVHQYLQGLRGIDLSACPEDVRNAYMRHIAAWSEYETALNADSGSLGLGTLIGIGGALYTGGAGWLLGAAGDIANADQKQREYADKVRAANDRVSQTWYEVRATAMAHDARLPE